MEMLDHLAQFGSQSPNLQSTTTHFSSQMKKKIRENFLVNHHLSWATLRRLKTKFSIPWCCVGKDRPGGPGALWPKKNNLSPRPKIKRKILFYDYILFYFQSCTSLPKTQSHSLFNQPILLAITQLKNLTKTKL